MGALSPEEQDGSADAGSPTVRSGPDAEVSSPDVVVVGGGCIGLATAWRTARAGLRVALVDPSPGRGASWAAAGMLAPVTEVQAGEEALLGLNLISARRYPSFVEELEDEAGTTVGYRACGTLFVAADGGDRAVLGDLHRLQASLGLDVALLTGRECRALEPMLAPGVRGGILAPGDHQVDSRRLTAALLTAARRSGVRIHQCAAAEVAVSEDRVLGVRLGDGERVSTPTVVLAAGCWSSRLAGLPPGAVPLVRPVKGQILRLRGPSDPPFLSRNLRGVAGGSQVYLVPRGDGRIVLGATVEESGFDTAVTAGGAYTLLRDAHQLLPGVLELELVEIHAGLRPGSPDNAPLLGPSPLPGLVLATGHHRNGVLLAPATADAMAAYLATGQLDDDVAAFAPGRFEAEPAR